jgi:hypothetical protein
MAQARRSFLHWRHHTPRNPSVEATAAGIYGVIVGAGVMAAAHTDSATVLTAAVLVTLFVYWCAERYARLVAEFLHEGRRPDRAHVRRQLASGWEIVTASFVPLAVLLVLRLLGADLQTSVLGALVASTLLLTLAGWSMGHRSGFALFDRLVVAAVAGLLGLLMIALKTVLH